MAGGAIAGSDMHVAVAIVGQLRGIALQRLLDPRSVDVEQVRRSVIGHWRRALAPT